MKGCLLLLLLLPLLFPLLVILERHIPMRRLEHFLDDWFGDPWTAKERRRSREAARERKRVKQRAYRARKRRRSG